MPGPGSFGPAGKWVHDRANRIMEDNPETPKNIAYAISVQQGHKVGKTPKDFRTPGGVRTAKKKYDLPKKEYQKTAEEIPPEIAEMLVQKGQGMQSTGRLTRNLGYGGALAGLGASFIPAIRNRPWLRRLVRGGAALGGMVGYMGEAGGIHQGRAYEMAGRKLRGEDVPEEEWQYSSPSVRQSLSAYFPQLENKTAGKLKTAEMIPGGKAEGRPFTDFPIDQLIMGKEVEKEHTSDPNMALEIAKDHLEEFPNYYTALKGMEDKLKSQKEKAADVEGEVPATGRVIPRADVVSFFRQHPHAKDEQVHELAEAHQISPHDLETQVYGILGEKLKKEAAEGGAAALGTELLGWPGGIIGGYREGKARGALGAGLGIGAGLGAGLGARHLMRKYLTGGEFGRKHPLATAALEAVPLALGTTVGGAMGSHMLKHAMFEGFFDELAKF